MFLSAPHGSDTRDIAMNRSVLAFKEENKKPKPKHKIIKCCDIYGRKSIGKSTGTYIGKLEVFWK